MMKKKTIALLSCGALMAGLLAGCGNSSSSTSDASSAEEDTGNVLEATTVYVDIAASLSSSFDEIIPLYNESQPNVTISINSGSSGKLLTEIEEAAGHGVDIFFSAGKKQVTTLNETDGLVVEGSIVELLQNQLCLVTGKDSGTAVTGWENIADAANMALCDGTVPVGKYTREAFVALGYLEDSDDNSAYTTDDVSAALGGLEINECANVSVAAQAVAEGSNEIGTIYYSDYFDFQDDLDIIAQDDNTLTGPIIYPVCQVANPEADDAELAATEDFLAFLQTDEVKQIFVDHCFAINS
jgi:molybdate transport system substrate-binding protein